jgi:rhodanese-related sulfurtransferase
MKLKALALTAVAAIAMTTTASFAKPVGISTAGELEVKAGDVSFSRNQDNNNTVNPAFAKTSRPCPPFCIQPSSLAPNVETIAETEVIHYVKKMKEGDSSIAVIDSRTPDWVAKGTIPGAQNLPFTLIKNAMKNLDAGALADTLKKFGVKVSDSGDLYNYSNAKTLVMFCNGMWCGQSPTNIKDLLALGYPSHKIKWYRGGMQNWEILGLNTAK